MYNHRTGKWGVFVETELLESGSLSPTETVTYMNLVSYTNSKRNYCYPKVETIAQRIGMSNKTTAKAIKTLQEKGFLEIVQTRKNGTFSKNYYYLNTEAGIPHHVQKTQQDVQKKDAAISLFKGAIETPLDQNSRTADFSDKLELPQEEVIFLNNSLSKKAHEEEEEQLQNTPIPAIPLATEEEMTAIIQEEMNTAPEQYRSVGLTAQMVAKVAFAAIVANNWCNKAGRKLTRETLPQSVKNYLPYEYLNALNKSRKPYVSQSQKPRERNYGNNALPQQAATPQKTLRQTDFSTVPLHATFLTADGQEWRKIRATQAINTNPNATTQKMSFEAVCAVRMAEFTHILHSSI